MRLSVTFNKRIYLGAIMYKILFFTMFFVSLTYAEALRPQIYASIGEPVYDSAAGYKALLSNPYYLKNHGYLQNFVSRAEALQEEGLLLDQDNTKTSRASYVKKLRALLDEATISQHKLEDDLQDLLEHKNFALLKQLKKSELLFIRNSVAVKTALQERIPQEVNPKIEDNMTIAGQNFKALKIKLLQARHSDDPRANCLNDITAVAYWMETTDSIKRDACKAYNACQQVTSFIKAAKVTCTKEDLLYRDWLERSKGHRTILKDRYQQKCNKN